jgi:translation initiation factor eIF-2B subunit beta
VGNIIRRVLGLIRDEQDDTRGESDLSSPGSDTGSRPHTPQTEASPSGVSFSPPSIAPRRDFSEPFTSSRPPLISQHTGAHGRPPVTSMFSILAHTTMASPGSSSPAGRSGTATPSMGASFSASADFREEVKQGITEIIDELTQSDEQIANYALEHIHPSEIIFTYSASLTVQRFLLKAASKRKFTLIHAEAYPNHHQKSHAIVTGRMDSEGDELNAESFQKPLTSAGVSVIMIPDSAIFAVMSRVNKVILGAHTILSNGSIVAAAGTKIVAKAARYHHVPVLVLAGTYKLSPKYPHDPSIFVEYGNVEKVVNFQDGAMKLPNIDVSNPIYDLVDSKDIDLIVTNLGGVASGYLYRVVREQYRDEDAEL